MRGDIVKKMCDGIDKTKCVVVFVTDNYIKKVDSTNFNDNCQLEFKYSMRQKSGALMVPVCMEPEMSNALKWKGPVGMVLGGTIYVSATDDSNYEQSFQDLYDAINKCITDNYPSFLQIGNIVKKNKAPTTNADVSDEMKPAMIVTKYDADDVRKNIRAAQGNLTEKTVPENSVAIGKKALSDLLEALREGPHRQHDFAENGTCETVADFLKKAGSIDDDLTILLLKCIGNLCAYKESELDPFICHSENIASFVSSDVFTDICNLICESKDLEMKSTALYTIAALADDNDACIAFNDDNTNNVDIVASCCPKNLDKSHLPLLKNFCLAVARLNAFEVNKKMKVAFLETSTVKRLVKAYDELGSKDDGKICNLAFSTIYLFYI